MRMHVRTLISLLIIVILFVGTLNAQTNAGDPGGKVLAQGKQFFQQGRYTDALNSFRELGLTASTYQPEASFWMVKSLLALQRLDEAHLTLENYLSKFQSDSNRIEALYLRGRILYLAGDIQGSVAAFSQFLEQYRSSSFAANAYYWMAEGLLAMGKLDEAEKLFKVVLADYSSSFKAEAASYKLGLINLKHREEEILALLTWSHEENIKNLEDFQRRETVYQEAIRAYQTRLVRLAPEDFKVELSILQGRFEQVQSKLTAAESRRDELNIQLKDAQTRLQAALERVALLEKELSRSGTKKDSALEQIEERQRLLDAREEALRIKERALEALELQGRQ